MKRILFFMMMMVAALPCMASVVEAAVVASAAKPGTPALTAVNRLGWVDEGWSLYENGNPDDAMQAWQHGVADLSADKVLLFAGVFREREKAFQQLDVLGREHHAIMVRRFFQAAPAFYVLISPPDKLLEAARSYLSGALGSVARGRAAIFFQHTIVTSVVGKGAVEKETAPETVKQKDSLLAVSEGAGYTPPPIVHYILKNKSAFEIQEEPPLSPMQLKITARPVDVPQLFAAVRMALTAGNHDKALSLVAELFARKPGSTEVRVIYARLLVLEGHYDQATSLLLPLLSAENMNDWRPWFWAGTAQLVQGNLDQAAIWLNKSLARNGSQAAVWVQRALVEQQRDNHAAALQMLYMADSVQPGIPAVQLNIAWSSEAVGDIQGAHHAYRSFLKISTEKLEYTNIRLKVVQYLLNQQ